MKPIQYEDLVNRNIGIVTEEEQALLKSAQAAVFGLGGLGGVIAQVLARTGIGGLKLVDRDRFEPTNLNRQVFATEDTLGEWKTEAAAGLLRKINPALSIQTFRSVTESNIGPMLEGTRVALLAIDSVKPCLIASRAARARGIPLVEGWAVPYANVRVFTKDSPALEDVYGLGTAGRGLDSLTDDECRGLTRRMLDTLSRIEGIGQYYPPRALERLERGETPSFAPFVWLTAVRMSLEAVKIILGWGTIASAPAYALYDPLTHRIPRQEE